MAPSIFLLGFDLSETVTVIVSICPRMIGSVPTLIVIDSAYRLVPPPPPLDFADSSCNTFTTLIGPPAKMKLGWT